MYRDLVVDICCVEATEEDIFIPNLCNYITVGTSWCVVRITNWFKGYGWQTNQFFPFRPQISTSGAAQSESFVTGTPVGQNELSVLDFLCARCLTVVKLWTIAEACFATPIPSGMLSAFSTATNGGETNNKVSLVVGMIWASTCGIVPSGPYTRGSQCNEGVFLTWNQINLLLHMGLLHARLGKLVVV